jgi:predicted MFS family arabinose efflux permease
MLLASAVLLDCSGILAMGVVGASALSIVEDVGRGEGFVGALVTAFFVVGSATALVVGRGIDRVGARSSALVAGAVTAVVALPVLATTDDSAVMLAGCAVAGSAFAITLPATNAVLRTVVPAERMVFAVCIKQAAIPLALVLASTVAPSLGRRDSFALADLLAIGSLFAFAWWSRRPPKRQVAEGSATELPPERGVVRYGAATLLASLLAGTLIGYSALTLSRAGLSPSGIALVLMIGSLCGIAARVLSGGLTQRWGLRSWWPVTAMMVVGAGGTACLSSDRPAVVVVGCLLAFTFGWGWSGLTFGLVLASSTHRPGMSGAMLQAGGMLGSAIGPALMGLIVGVGGYRAGWWVTAAALALAGLLVAPPLRGIPRAVHS